MNNRKNIPTITMNLAATGRSKKQDELGMLPMQARAYTKRGEQYLLIKSPPASGKSRALMFIALDKLANHGLKQAIIAVPEKTIGASFHDEPLSDFGFRANWQVKPRWNLCNAPGEDGGKINAVKEFLNSGDSILICTHATFRFAVERFGVNAFDNRLIAVDEFHHVSANPDNKLGAHLGEFMARDKVHIVAMTGSYFRGDAEAVLAPADEAKFQTVTYTYYEQLHGYEYLKSLDIGYYFYSGSYLNDILSVLNPGEKTIIHIPNVNSRESTKDKIKEVDHILDKLGEWKGTDPDTGFHIVKTKDGRTIKIADLVDDDQAKRDKVSSALKRPEEKNNRDHLDIIIALGMAKEGFDWIWCEHALTVGHRASLTEIVQIIGRTTRDAPGKTRARFTNLIEELDAPKDAVAEAVNNTLKAIAVSLLMEQVLAPKFNFLIKATDNKAIDGYDYGEKGFVSGGNNVGLHEETGEIMVEIDGLVEPKSNEAKRICREDLKGLVTAFIQDKPALERGLLDEDTLPEELTQIRMGKIVQERYPDLDEEDQEAIRQRAIATFNITQKAREYSNADESDAADRNTAMIDGVRKFVMDVRDLNMNLIDRIKSFGTVYAIMAKSMSEELLKQLAAVIAAKRINLTHEEAYGLALRAVKFKAERGRLPSIIAQDRWEKRLAEGIAFIQKKVAESKNECDPSDKELLSQLGVDVTPRKVASWSPLEERIIAGFEEIQHFVEDHGQQPTHAEDRDIFERLNAVRLDQIRRQKKCRDILEPHDHQGLLDDDRADDDLSDEELLAQLGIEASADGSIANLKHVKPRVEVKSPEEIASHKPCDDFDTFKPIFVQIRADVLAGKREITPYKNNANIDKGDFFILSGQTVYVANMGDEFTTDYQRKARRLRVIKDRRLRVIYDNGTESDILLRSLQRALNKDKTGRRIKQPTAGPLFSDNVESSDHYSGIIYVARSLSDMPEIQQNQNMIHKIGVTGGNIEQRIADAENSPTFLMAKVEIVATFKLYNIKRVKFESLIHQFFRLARLNIKIKDRFGRPIQPEEWFMVSLLVIKEVVKYIQDGTIGEYAYDVEKLCLQKIG